PDINLIPLIDILIVILIFLFLTTTYSRYAELQINLPEASAERATDKPSMLTIAVDSAGKYAINGVSTPFGSPANTAGASKGAAHGPRDPTLRIGAVAAAPHQPVSNVMDARRLAGNTHISSPPQTRR